MLDSDTAALGPHRMMKYSKFSCIVSQNSRGQLSKTSSYSEAAPMFPPPGRTRSARYIWNSEWMSAMTWTVGGQVLWLECVSLHCVVILYALTDISSSGVFCWKNEQTCPCWKNVKVQFVMDRILGGSADWTDDGKAANIAWISLLLCFSCTPEGSGCHSKHLCRYWTIIKLQPLTSVWLPLPLVGTQKSLGYILLAAVSM